MGKVVQLYEIGNLAECPDCSGDRWFIRMADREDSETDYESDLEWALNIIAVTCVECGQEFPVRHDGIVFEPEFGLEGDEECLEQSQDLSEQP